MRLYPFFVAIMMLEQYYPVQLMIIGRWQRTRFLKNLVDLEYDVTRLAGDDIDIELVKCRAVRRQPIRAVQKDVVLFKAEFDPIFVQQN